MANQAPIQPNEAVMLPEFPHAHARDTPFDVNRNVFELMNKSLTLTDTKGPLTLTGPNISTFKAFVNERIGHALDDQLEISLHTAHRKDEVGLRYNNNDNPRVNWGPVFANFGFVVGSEVDCWYYWEEQENKLHLVILQRQ